MGEEKERREMKEGKRRDAFSIIRGRGEGCGRERKEAGDYDGGQGK
jgi:hypothetical protein